VPPSGHLGATEWSPRTIGKTDEREASGPIPSVGSLNIPCLPASVEVVGLPVGVLEASPIGKVSPIAVGVLEAPPTEKLIGEFGRKSESPRLEAFRSAGATEWSPVQSE
jgi:hypothetical protein